MWNILHQPALLTSADGTRLFALYPLIPWIGVMAAGYALGPLFKAERATRVQWLVLLGVAVTVGFVLLRATNLYGDPQPWVAHDSALATLLSFINTEKYPPSLLYLMMTLGPGLLLLAAFETARGRVVDTVVTFGRVPFAYYIVHIYLIHALAIGLCLVDRRRCLLADRRVPAGEARRLRARPRRRLCGVARGAGRALSALPLVRGAEAAPQRLVAELLVTPVLR